MQYVDKKLGSWTNDNWGKSGNFVNSHGENSKTPNKVKKTHYSQYPETKPCFNGINHGKSVTHPSPCSTLAAAQVKYASDWSVFHLCNPDSLFQVPEDETRVGMVSKPDPRKARWKAKKWSQSKDDLDDLFTANHGHVIAMFGFRAILANLSAVW